MKVREVIGYARLDCNAGKTNCGSEERHSSTWKSMQSTSSSLSLLVEATVLFFYIE